MEVHIDQTEMLAVIHEICSLNEELIVLVQNDPFIRDVMKDVLVQGFEGNNKLISKLIEHQLMIIDSIENAIEILNKK